MIRKNISGQGVGFCAVNASTGAAMAGTTGFAAFRVIDGGTQASATGTVTDKGNGQYWFATSQADVNGNDISLLFTMTGMVPVEKTIVTTACDPTAATNFGITALPTATAGASGGLLISGSNSGTTTLAALTVTGATTLTGNVAMAAGLTVTQSTTNGAGISVTGNGTGAGVLATGGATGHGISATSGATSGDGIRAGGGTLGHGLNLIGAGTSRHGLLATGGATTGSGISAVGGSTSGDAILTSATSGHGVTFAGTGTTKHGINATGGSTTSAGIAATGGGAGAGVLATAGATGIGLSVVGGSTSGAGFSITTTSGDGFSVTPTAGNAIVATANGTSKHGFVVTGGTAGTSDGLKAVAGTGGVDVRANQTGNLTGNVSGSVGSVTGAVGSVTGAVGSVTGLTASDVGAIKTKTDFLPSATAGAAGGLFIAGTNAATTVTTSFTTTFTGNLTGSVDSVIGAVGSVTGLTASDVGAIKTKTDFLPSATAGAAGGVFIAGTNAATTVTTSFTTTFTGNLTGSVGSVTGNVGGNVTGSVGSISGVTFPTNFSVLAIAATTGQVGIDWANIKSPTTTVALTGTTIATVTNQLAATAIADAVLSRNVSNVEGTMPLDCLGTVILATIHWAISGTDWVIKRTDNATTHATRPLGTAAGADSVTSVG